jgi:hypothetical protein
MLRDEGLQHLDARLTKVLRQVHARLPLLVGKHALHRPVRAMPHLFDT